MACNKDEECLRIANKIYPGLIEEIDGSIANITNSISEITSELSSISVPGDYLGEKVTGRIQSICSNLNSDESNIKSTGKSIDGFVKEKIKEHQKHYEEWKLEQERMAAARRSIKLKAQKEKTAPTIGKGLAKNIEITK